MTTALASNSKLFHPKKLLIGAYYPVQDVVPHPLMPPGVVRRDFQWRCEVSGERLHAVARYMGEKRAPLKDEFFISGAIPAAYRAGCGCETKHAIGALVFVSRRTVEIITPFEAP